jgi:hypothetical protein
MRGWLHWAQAAAFVSSFVAIAACATYGSSLARGQRAFEDGDLERSLAIFRVLEGDLDHLSLSERAQYAYLRGTVDFRMGYRADARHWLALGDALEAQTPGSLPAEWTERLRSSLHDLDEEVFTSASGGGAKPDAD